MVGYHAWPLRGQESRSDSPTVRDATVVCYANPLLKAGFGKWADDTATPVGSHSLPSRTRFETVL